MTEPNPVYILANQTNGRLTPHSIEFSRNAKQEPSWTLKVYYADNEEGQALTLITALDHDLRARFVKDAS